MAKGPATIEWTMQVARSGNATVRQVDSSGVYRVPFPSADLAGAWILTQAEFARNEMGFTFTNI